MENTVTVSNLIRKLQAILEKHGDIGVYHVEFGGLTELEGTLSIDEIENVKIVVIE
jgi:hypothetical protein